MQSGGRRAELIIQELNTVTGGKRRATRRNSGGRRVILKALLWGGEFAIFGGDILPMKHHKYTHRHEHKKERFDILML